MNTIKRLISSIFRKFGYRISRLPSDDFLPTDMEEHGFREAYEKVKSYTVTSKERMYALYKAVEYLSKNRVPGDFVECGVWKGGSSMLAALSFLQCGDISRNIYLYDTFAGMSNPTERDSVIGVEEDSASTMEKWRRMEKPSHNKWTYAPVDEVKKNMENTGYPPDKIRYIKGKVEDTIPEIVPRRIALLRLDTDWYESTKHEMEHLFPLLEPGGVLLLDDYGHWAGARDAVDEYMLENNITIFLSRIDGAGRIAIKQS